MRFLLLISQDTYSRALIATSGQPFSRSSIFFDNDDMAIRLIKQQSWNSKTTWVSAPRITEKITKFIHDYQVSKHTEGGSTAAM